jgi:hypothetical protein
VQRAKAYLRAQQEAASIDGKTPPEVLTALGTLGDYISQPLSDPSEFWRLHDKLMPGKAPRKPVGVEENMTGKLAAGQYDANTTAQGNV